jgi:hypothetical protein
MTDFVFDRFTRTCDVCGRACRGDELRSRDGIYICNRHPGYRTAQELDRLNSQRRIPPVKYPTNTRPWSPEPTWELEESQIFRLVVDVAPFETFDITGDGAGGIINSKTAQAAAWAIVYLHALITEAKRPQAWRTQALAKAIECGDFMISQQNGRPGDSATSSNSATYGADSFDTTAYTTGVACAAFMKLYQLTGSGAYLDAAKRSANYIVNLQAGALWAHALISTITVTYGPPAHSVVFIPGAAANHTYYPRDLLCMWGLTLLRNVAGDGTYGAPGTVSGVFTASPARTLSNAIDAMRSFWATGAAGPDGIVKNGFSSATPFEFFWPVNGGWLSSTITAQNWAEAVFALYQTEGASSQVLANWAYLQTFASNAAFELPDKVSIKSTLESEGGTFDATLAPSTTLDAAARTNGSSVYDWASGGLMAAIQSQLSSANLLRAKEVLAVPRQRTAEGTSRDGRFQWLGPLGASGLSFQPYSGPDSGAPPLVRQESVVRAAKVGFYYRYRQTFMGAQ